MDSNSKITLSGDSGETTNLLIATRKKTEQQRALTGVISRIRESLELNVIFGTTATDRVAVFQFDPSRDWEGEFISESVNPDFLSALTTKVYDHCFGPQYAAFYEAGRMQVVDDIQNANLSPCHMEILGQFQVRSKSNQLASMTCNIELNRMVSLGYQYLLSMRKLSLELFH